MVTKSNLNKLLSNYATEDRKAKAAWKKAIMKIHPNKGGNTAYFQEMSRLFNTYYKGNNTARIQNTPPPRTSPPPRPSPPPPPRPAKLTRDNVRNAMYILLRRGELVLNGIKYKVYAWPKDSSARHTLKAQSIFKKIIPNINSNAYSFKYSTDPLIIHPGVKNKIAVNRALSAYFRK